MSKNKKYIIQLASGSNKLEMDRDEIITFFKNGRINEKALISEPIALGLTTSPMLLECHVDFSAEIAVLAQERDGLLARKAQIERDIEIRSDSLKNPPDSLIVLVKDVEIPERHYSIFQIRKMIESGALTADAKFQHPNYPEEWALCLNIYEANSPLIESKLNELIESNEKLNITLKAIRWNIWAIGASLAVLILFGVKMRIQ